MHWQSLLIFTCVCNCHVILDFTIDWGKTIVENARDQVNVVRPPENKATFISEMRFGSEDEKVMLKLDFTNPDLVVPEPRVKCFAKPELGWLAQQSMPVEATTCTDHGSYASGPSCSFKRSPLFLRPLHENDSLVMAYPLYYQRFVDGTEARGTWVYDNVYIGGAYITEQMFVAANMTTKLMGSIGLGVRWTRWNGNSENFAYHHLPFQLVNHDHIMKAIYSIYLDKFENNRGTILFGAFDHAKFEGKLTTMHMVKFPAEYVDLDRARIKVPVQDGDWEFWYNAMVEAAEANDGVEDMPDDFSDIDKDDYPEGQLLDSEPDDDDDQVRVAVNRYSLEEENTQVKRYYDEDNIDVIDEIDDDEWVTSFLIKMGGISLLLTDGQEVKITGKLYPVLLDYDATVTVMPRPAFNRVMENLGGKFERGVYLILCEQAESRVQMRFGNTFIRFSVSEWMGEIEPGKCALTILPSDDVSTHIRLGNDSLRQMYVIVDLEDMEVTIAQIKRSQESQIQELKYGVPGAGLM